jgi:chemotaxis protein CheC
VASGENTADLTRVRDISERSVRRAEESVRRLLGHSVRLTLRGIHPLSTLVEDAEGGSMAGLQLQITGQGNGRILILFPLPMVFRFLQVLLGGAAEPRPLMEMERSAIQEVGNIMASSFLSELGDLLGRRLLHSSPEMHIENIPQLVRDVATSLRASGSELLVIQGAIEDGEHQPQGRFFFVPEAAALEPIARSTAGNREGFR